MPCHLFCQNVIIFACNISMNVDEIYMKKALSQALAAEREGEIPIGAVIVCENHIIAQAHNLTERLNDPTAHAELLAITAATHYLGGKYLNGCAIYVTVEPCPMCAAALAWAQVGRIVYGAKDPQRGYTLFTPSLLHVKTQVSYGILEKECGEIMSDFFKKIRK